MNTIAEKIGSQFVLALGDNFYDNGIQTNCYDPRFSQTFADVFTEDNLQTKWCVCVLSCVVPLNHRPRYVLAGNHDHYGNVSAEIAYTGLSPRWTFPNYYYTEVFNFNTAAGPKTFQIVFIDTVLLAGLASHDDTFGALPGPADTEVALTQWQWINETLANSTADYLWVAGHYPVWSVCEHGPTQVCTVLLNCELLIMCRFLSISCSPPSSTTRSLGEYQGNYSLVISLTHS